MRKRFRKRRHNRGTLSGLKYDQLVAKPIGKCMKIPEKEDLVSLAEWKRWFYKPEEKR